MATSYGMGVFLKLSFGWVVRLAHVEFKRPLNLGDSIIVTTWIDEMFSDGVKVQFEIAKKANGKLCCDGNIDYTMVSLNTGRAEPIPDAIKNKYSI